MIKLMVHTAAALVALSAPMAAMAATTGFVAPVSSAVRPIAGNDTTHLGVSCMLISIKNGRDMCSASNQTHQGGGR